MSENHKCPACGAPLPMGTPGNLCPDCLLKQGLQANTAGYTAEDARADASPWQPPQIAELAALFPELEIIRLIGRGGMGAVYEVRQKNLDRPAALKILPPEIGRDPAFAQRFAREAQALAKLSHANIVAVYDFGQRHTPPPATMPQASDTSPSEGTPGDVSGDDGLFYFLMEYVDGLNLRQVLNSGKMSPSEALAVVPQICDALQYAHDHGIVHRDIKPENILLNKQGQVKIADFGLAKLVGRPPASQLGAEQSGGKGAPEKPAISEPAVMGTPSYMAPEQRERPSEVDHRADIYSLGVVFYQMLTGELPKDRFMPPSRKVHIDVRLDEVVLRALEHEPSRRYQHASEVKTEVETIVGTRDDVGAETDAEASHSANADVKNLESVHREIRGPATWLLITGILNWVLHVSAFLIIGRLRVEPFPGVLIAVAAAFVLDSAIIYGAHKMRRLESRRAAILASILAIVVSPGNLIGLPIGIWALIVLGRSRVALAFEAQTATGETSSSPSPSPFTRSEKNLSPRFSLTAIIGAAWAPWFFIAFVLMFTGFAQVRVTSGTATPVRSWWGYLLMFTMLLLGLTAPFGTTTCGVVALSQIRHSASRLYGLGLALVDALLFPLLALDFIIWWILGHLPAGIAHQWINQHGLHQTVWNDIIPWCLILFVVVVSAIVDFLIIRWAWRAANKPTDSSAAPPSPPHDPQSERQSERRKPQARSLWRWGFWMVLAALVLVAGGAFAAIHFMGQQNVTLLKHLAQNIKATHPGVKATLPSGATVELVGLSENPSHGHAWWKPNGSPLLKAPYQQMGGIVYAQQSEVAREVVVRLGNLPAGRIDRAWQFVPSGSTAGSGRPYSHPPMVDASSPLRTIAVTFPADRKECTVRFGLADGPWSTAASSRGRGGESGSGPIKNFSWSFAQATESVKGVSISVAHNLTNVAYRVVAIDKRGRTITSGRSTSGGTTQLTQTTAHFPGLRLAQVKRFELQSRPYQWVEFRHVALRAGHETHPTVRVLGNASPSGITNAPAAASAAFGPVIERSINDPHGSTASCFIDLDSGRLLSIPNTLISQWKSESPTQRNKDADAWAKRHGVDAAGMVVLDAHLPTLPAPSGASGDVGQAPTMVGLSGIDLFAVNANDDDWNSITPKALEARLAQAKLQYHGPPQAAGQMVTDHTFPATYLFQTREGGRGILQILGSTVNRGSVQIRYELVR